MRLTCREILAVVLSSGLPALCGLTYQKRSSQTVLNGLPDDDSAPLPMANPTRSFWTDSSPDANPLAREGSEGPLTTDADVCIIGSGMTGVSAAYHFASAVKTDASLRPLKAVVFEARDFCSGATGANGGHLAPHKFFEFRRNVKAFGYYDAIKGVDIEEHVASEIARILKTEGLEDKVDFVDGGRINLLFTQEEEDEAREDYEAAKIAGVDLSSVQWLSKEDVQKTYGAPYPAVRIPAANIWPLKFVTALYELARNATPAFSLHLHTRTPVTSIHRLAHDGGRRARQWALQTPRGRVSCAYVLHATNAYASHLLPQLAGPVGIVPARGQIIAVRANATAAQLTDSGFTGNEMLEYWFARPTRTPDERPLVILGGGREVSEKPYEMYEADDGELNPDVGRALRDFLPGVFPGYFEKGREPEMEWSGIMGFTLLGDPFVGPVLKDFSDLSGSSYSGQYIAAGYSGHGMPRAFGCADVVSRMILARIQGTEWEQPDWLPVHYITSFWP
ncbi:FAD dependent oxidoreductase [Artomyces pyxidatus]|uniref:FAD dependent oxidoreductase n=1 Tax=Artomyces pyxidatus TaxID=48021 RepID=A0ACB8SMD7_9AGAM|nr:FAD dependent oxidoreductase [Artomyces pyxidatus]